MSSFISPNGNDGGVIAGDNGDNEISAAGGDDVVSAAGGDDSVRGGTGDDSIKGGTGADSINGGEGDDSINGGAGDDIVIGGEGNDKLAGGLGDDVISGGSGNNAMSGGDGADTFVFGTQSTGNDKVLDFEVGIDDSRLNDVSAVSFFENSAGHTIVTLDTGGTIMLRNVSEADAMDAFGYEAPAMVVDAYPVDITY